MNKHDTGTIVIVGLMSAVFVAIIAMAAWLEFSTASMKQTYMQECVKQHVPHECAAAYHRVTP